MLKFEKKIIDRRNNFEAASAFDVNNDGIKDIVCGQYWYEGPHYLTRHQIQDLRPIGDDMQDVAYQDDFSDFPMDVNGDGNTDIITGAFWNSTVRWLENPGHTGELWKAHDIAFRNVIETIRYYDIDNCGTAEIFPNNNDTPACFIKLVKDENGKGTGEFVVHELNPQQERMGHGIGIGDVNGDGLADVITVYGWYENPGDIYGTWTFHDDFNFEELTGAWAMTDPAVVYDVNGDGLNDIICSNAHGYGLYWMEQHLDENGKRTWIKHDIDTEHAQYHDMQLCDIDNDGELELVTGKRWQAHCGNDPGDNDDCFIYIYKINGGKFDRFVVEEGPASDDHSGVGIYFWLEDLDGNGYKDIICPGKEGLFLFINKGESN